MPESSAAMMTAVLPMWAQVLAGVSILAGVGLMVLALVQARSRVRGHRDEASRERAALDELTQRVEGLHEELEKTRTRLQRVERAATQSKAQSASVLEASRPRMQAAAPRVIEAKPADHAPVGVPEAHARVYVLADAGKTAVEIAQETGTPTGQVELILNLRRAMGVG